MNKTPTKKKATVMTKQQLYKQSEIKLSTTKNNWGVEIEIKTTIDGLQLQYICERFNLNPTKKDDLAKVCEMFAGTEITPESVEVIEEYLSMKKYLKSLVKNLKNFDTSALSKDDSLLFLSQIIDGHILCIDEEIHQLCEDYFGDLEEGRILLKD